MLQLFSHFTVLIVLSCTSLFASAYPRDIAEADWEIAQDAFGVSLGFLLSERVHGIIHESPESVTSFQPHQLQDLPWFTALIDEVIGRALFDYRHEKFGSLTPEERLAKKEKLVQRMETWKKQQDDLEMQSKEVHKKIDNYQDCLHQTQNGLTAIRQLIKIIRLLRNNELGNIDTINEFDKDLKRAKQKKTKLKKRLSDIEAKLQQQRAEQALIHHHQLKMGNEARDLENDVINLSSIDRQEALSRHWDPSGKMTIILQRGKFQMKFVEKPAISGHPFFYTIAKEIVEKCHQIIYFLYTAYNLVNHDELWNFVPKSPDDPMHLNLILRNAKENFYQMMVDHHGLDTAPQDLGAFRFHLGNYAALFSQHQMMIQYMIQYISDRRALAAIWPKEKKSGPAKGDIAPFISERPAPLPPIARKRPRTSNPL